jgi:phosphopantetheinyl transferase (holo-ACP synthase)
VIGNDIVDLLLAKQESNWQRRGYLDKIFNKEEQSVIFSSTDPAHTVWHLWSCKEAVYKIIHRHSRIRTYAPLKFSCSSDTVTYEGRLYPYKSYQTDSCIHTIAVEKHELFEAIEVHTGRREQWEITKDHDGVPFLKGLPVSVSHHGRYAGLVIYNDNSAGNSVIS